MNVAIVAAAGQGRRIGGKTRKQYFLLKDKPLLIYSLEVLESSSFIDQVVLVVPPGDARFCQELLKKYHLKKVIKIVEGRTKRQDSIFQGLKILSPEAKIVLVHDGARPFITLNLIKQVFLGLKGFQGVAPALPLSDTIKVVHPAKGGANKSKITTLDRGKLISVQTPQVFLRDVLYQAYLEAKTKNFYGTDDAELVERIGGKLKIIEGSLENIKITTPLDLLFAEAILSHKIHHS